MHAVLETLLESRKAVSGELEDRRSKLMEELEKLVHGDDGTARSLSTADEERASVILSEVDQIDAEIDEATKVIDKRIKQEEKRAKKAAKLAEARETIASAITGPVTTKEPFIYGIQDGVESPNSYYADLSRRALSGYTGNDGGATQRLSEYAHQVERDYALGEKRGKEIEVALRDLNREFGAIEGPKRMAELRDRGRVALDAKNPELPEVREGLTGGGPTATLPSPAQGAAFVTPVFTEPDYVVFRELGRPFADACTKKPLPDYGMTIYTPAVKSAIEVAGQTEGGNVNETNIESAFGYLSGSLATIAGEQYLSQQLLDRAGPSFQFDKMIFDQLERNYAKKFDVAVLEKALINAKENTWTGNGGLFALYAKGAAGGFVGQVAKAKGEMRKEPGLVLNPTHLFLTQSRWEHISATTDEQGRPVVNPQYAGPFEAIAAGSSDGDEGVEGATGYRMAGLPVYQDGSIPKSGTFTGTAEQDQAIVGCLREVWVYEGSAVTRALPQTKGDKLLVLLQRYSYWTVIKRYDKAVITISGTGFRPPVYTN